MLDVALQRLPEKNWEGVIYRQNEGKKEIINS
jgi:hypothetical protein